ncbi:MAG: prepilin-type N-terminal cleavage/methylation domain-containing protein [Longimicrobiales bacterium]
MQNRKGFTLIELLIVVVIIGILAAIALPKFGQTRERAYYTTMTADLSNLRSSQEMYYQTTGNFNYADNLTDLDATASSGVNVDITEGTNLGWAATATHDALGADHGCAIMYGEVATPPQVPGGEALTTDQEGRPVCDE